MYVAFLSKLADKKYKYIVKVFRHDRGMLIPQDVIKFGAAGYDDYTIGAADQTKRKLHSKA